jgi:hypothetical protein
MCTILVIIIMELPQTEQHKAKILTQTEIQVLPKSVPTRQAELKARNNFRIVLTPTMGK